MTERGVHEEKALETLLSEVRREPLPHVAWDAVEASLLARIERGEHVPSVARGSRRWPWLVAAAAMVTVLAAYVGVRGRSRSGGTRAALHDSSGRASIDPSRIDGDALTLGAIVVAGATPVSVEHRGHVTWTLDPNGQARIESVGDVITLALDRGTLTAHVTKSPRPESFVVRVERTRVAVHGTVFRVERRDGTSLIAVQEGVVAVGPLEKQGFLLRAPDTAVVTFDGLRADAPAADRALASGQGSEPASARAKEHNRAASSREEERLASAEVERVVASVRTCFGQLTVSGGDLRITVSTHMSLVVTPAGKIAEAEFEPPLVPAVRSCVDSELREIPFPRSNAGFDIERVLELEH